MKGLVGLLAVAVLLAGNLTAGRPVEAAPARLIPATGKAIPNQYIVVLKEGANARSIAASAGVSPRHVYEAALNGFAATLNAGQLNALQHNPHVDYVEQDGEVSINASQFNPPWGLDRIDQRNFPLNGTYTYTATASNVTAYVLDTGIATAHPDFGGRATNVYDARGGNGQDCNGHGTHVAGTIGSTTYGVAKQVRLRGVRVLDCNGGGVWSDIIDGMNWVANNGSRPAVVNMSLSGSYNTTAHNAAINLVNRGFTLVAAAGNNNADACNYSPGSLTPALTVAASDQFDNRFPLSNYGGCMDLYAPGENITSTWLNGGTTSTTGTSMAAPHVAGCAAKYLSTNPSALPNTVHSWIIGNATVGLIKGNPPNTPNRLLYCPL
jgi:subtilisin family serine protease